ncbi:MAG: hypothetical protein V1850_00765 [Candidatus Bathyarchaeota archaeon]
MLKPLAKRLKAGERVLGGLAVWTGRGRVGNALRAAEPPTFEALISVSPLDGASADTAFY